MFPTEKLLRYVLMACLAVAAYVCIWSIWAHLQIGLNNDHLTLMDQAKKLLQGAVPYVTYTDVSPPMIHLIYIPAALAALAGMPTYLALYMWTYLLISLSLLACYHILKSSVPLNTLLIALCSLALALLGVSFIHQPFADREHLLMVLIAPWLVLYSPLVQRESAPLRWRITAAVMAGIGFAIKPYFYGFYLFSFLFTLISLRSFRAILRQSEHHIVWNVALIYLLIVMTHFREYVTTILSIGLLSYQDISWSVSHKMYVITHRLVNFVYPSLYGIGLLLLLNWRLCDKLIIYLCLLLLPAVISYRLNAGWYYTQYPFIAVALVLLTAIGSRVVEACKRLPWNAPRIIAIVGLTVVVTGSVWNHFGEPALARAQRDMYSQQRHGHPYNFSHIRSKKLRNRLAYYLNRHPRFMMFSTSVWACTLLRDDKPWQNVGRFDFLWPLPGTVSKQKRRRQQESYQRLAAYLQQSITHDLIRQKPDIVFIDVSMYQRGVPMHYNVLDLLRRDKHFEAIWQQYKFVEKINQCMKRQKYHCAFEVYVRKKEEAL